MFKSLIKRIRISEDEIRDCRNYINSIAEQGGGTMYITYNNSVFNFQSDNFSETLFEIFHELMIGKSKNTKIERILRLHKIFEGRHNFTIEDLRKLKIQFGR